MKAAILVILALALLGASPVVLQADPVVVRQFGETSYTLRDVQFITPERGWAVGVPHWDQAARRVTGTIIATTDGGTTWDAAPDVPAVELRGVHFVDPQTGWAVGSAGTILHTADGGATWAAQPVATSDDFRGVAFADAMHGWATSIQTTQIDDWSGEPLEWVGTIWHTADGGQSWTQQALPEGASLLNRVDFVDAQTGWAVGIKHAGGDSYRPEHRGAIYHTTDGGATWQEQYTTADPIVFTGVDFIDAQHGWVASFPGNSGLEGGFVFYTADGGASWQRGEPGSAFAPLWDVHFVDQQRGYVVGADYISAWGPPVWRTLDGGATWEKLMLEKHDNEGLYGVSVIGDQLVAVGDHDILVRTPRAWAPPPGLGETSLFTAAYINVHYRFEDVHFVDAQRGWVVGRRSYGPSMWGQVILHTADGGATWETQYTHPPGEHLFSVHRLDAVTFADAQTGWAVGKSDKYGDPAAPGAILHTADGGATWHNQGVDLITNWDVEFFDVCARADGTIWALATRHTPDQTVFLARGTSSGDAWEWVDTGVEGMLAIGFALVQGELVFADAQHGWIAGGLGQVLHTADGGATWSAQQLTCDYPPCRLRTFTVAFTDPLNGWIGGEGLFHTTDGGQTWPPAPVELPGDVHTIAFGDAQTGWLAGDGGLLMLTPDGGQTWMPIDSGTFATLLGASVLPGGEVWLVGTSGMILYVSQQ